MTCIIMRMMVSTKCNTFNGQIQQNCNVFFECMQLNDIAQQHATMQYNIKDKEEEAK